MSPRTLENAYRYRGVLVAVPLVVGLVCSWHECGNHGFVWTAATVTFALGLMIRIWAQQHLHYRLKAETRLTVTGPYALVRNPVYIGNTLICAAFAIASELLWLVPITIATCIVVYTLVVRHEESVLLRQYGHSYAAYVDRVPRWFLRWQRGLNLQWSPDYLWPSLLAEAYNILFFVPFLLKELLGRKA